MKINRSGFTLVELTIVISVITILAIITVTSYSGIQRRSRDTTRLADTNNIIKAIDIYEGETGTFPATSASPGANGCTGNGYSYSWATDGTWLNPLVTGNFINTAPKPPQNSCTVWYAYLKPAPTDYGCSSRTKPYYVLWIKTEGAVAAPSFSKTFTPCVGSSITWTANSTNWIIASDNLPS